ncbi:hypothetical protein M0805_004000 [Coniferiporia weirii]|nr:hypothetical protein M0805_004000 [Coniferiporia weirii]
MSLGEQSTPSLSPSPSRSPSPVSPVQPDHFYSPDTDAHTLPPSPDSLGRSWLSPDDDPLATKGIPVFKPTMEEFSDFEMYMSRVECWGMRSGIVKIVPPAEWSKALPSVCAQLSDISIKSPIEQHMLGRSGLYRQQNIEKRKAISVREWAELCAKEDYRAPALDEVGLKAAGERGLDGRRRNKRRVDTTKEEIETVNVVVKGEAEDEPGLDAAPTPMPAPEVVASPDADADGDNNNDGADEENATVPAARKRRVQTRADRDAALAKRAALDATFMETFDPATAWLPRDMKPTDYTPAFCATLERRYWRNCGLGRPPWYGADTAGSLFTDATEAWNVSCLPSALARLLPASSNGLPGVNMPYLYFGMWRATFAWHVEDMDLFSINYIHFGAPKFWYAVPQARAVQLENTLRSFFPSDVAQCRQFLRHKSFLASPTLLAQSSCKPNTLVQHAGEFVVTYPRGYHAGFNLGFNCAESVNFALDSWLDIGRKAQVCGCIGDSVRIDVDALLLEREEERREASKPRSSRSRKSEGGTDAKPSSARKRKFDGTGLSKSKKPKIKVEAIDDCLDPSSSASIKQKIMLKVPKDLGPFPCCLCVSREQVGLLRVHDPPGAWAGCHNYTPRDAAGCETWHAHEACAMIVPETWVDEVFDGAGNAEKVVFGVDAIVRDRWTLKCTSCQKSRAKAHGAPIQCTKGKCPKAFHVSCARESGQEDRVLFTKLREVEKEVVLNDLRTLTPLEPSDEPTADDGTSVASNPLSIDPSLLTTSTEKLPDVAAAPPPARLRFSPQPNVIKTIKKIEYELLCAQHNPAVAATKRANKLDRVRNDLLALSPMSRIKLRVSAGVFEVSLIAVNEERNTVEVIWDDGIKREFKWSSLVWGKTEGQAVGQKPSVAAPPRDPHPMNNVRATGQASSSTPTPDVQAARQPTFSSGTGKAASGHPTQPYLPYPYNAACGQFQYGSGTYSYYSHPPIQPVANSSTIPYGHISSSPYGIVGSTPYGTQALYPYYSYPSGTATPPLGTYIPSHQQVYAPSTYSTFSLTGAKPHVSPFSQAFQQTLASSVASLPPRVGLPGTTPALSSIQSSRSGQIAPYAQSCSSTQILSAPPSETSSTSPSPMSNGVAPVESPGINPLTPQSEASPTTPNEGGSALSPDVLQAVEELQALSALEPTQLQEVLNARPALREAVKILLAHQAMQNS